MRMMIIISEKLCATPFHFVTLSCIPSICLCSFVYLCAIKHRTNGLFVFYFYFYFVFFFLPGESFNQVAKPLELIQYNGSGSWIMFLYSNFPNKCFIKLCGNCGISCTTRFMEFENFLISCIP